MILLVVDALATDLRQYVLKAGLYSSQHDISNRSGNKIDLGPSFSVGDCCFIFSQSQGLNVIECPRFAIDIRCCFMQQQ